MTTGPYPLTCADVGSAARIYGGLTGQLTDRTPSFPRPDSRLRGNDGDGGGNGVGGAGMM